MGARKDFPQGQPQDIKKAAAEAEKIIKQLQGEMKNGADKTKNKERAKNKAQKCSKGKSGTGRISADKVQKFFEVISRM